MQQLQANSPLLCNSCGKELGFVRRNVNVAQFLYCDECVKAKKFYPDHDFLINWDKDIFLEPFADFTLGGSDGGILRAHKAILAGKSKVFKTMLRAGMFESVSGKVKISDMTAGELRPLIDFLYTGRVKKRSLQCLGVALYRASVKYDLPLLTAICERFLENNAIRDVHGFFELAVTHGVEQFQEAVLPFIFCEGFVESNPPALVMKTLRAASKFECFAAHRTKNFKAVSFIMEQAFYRVADHFEDLHKGVEEPNEVLPGGHQTSTSDPPEVVANAPPLLVVSNKPLNLDTTIGMDFAHSIDYSIDPNQLHDAPTAFQDLVSDTFSPNDAMHTMSRDEQQTTHETRVNMPKAPVVEHANQLDVGGNELIDMSDSGRPGLCGLKRTLDFRDS